ncbi:MAG: PEP-CTERM sorting domain-containing protein [Chthoniobacterales bacterium]
MKIQAVKFSSRRSNFLTLAISMLMGFLFVGTASAQIYVAEAYTVMKYDINGTNGSVFATTGLSVNVYGVAVDSAGNVYVSDYTGDKINKYTSAGGGSGTAIYTGVPSTGNPFGLSVQGTDVYFAMRNSNTVGLTTTSGGTANLTYVPSAAGINVPVFTAIDSTGSFMYVTGYTSGNVIKVNLSTNAYTTFITGLTHATGIAVDASGNVYVAQDTAGRISEYSSAGGSTPTVANFITGLSHPYGLSLLGNDLYVANNATGSGTTSYIGEYDITNPSSNTHASLITGLTNAIDVDVVPEPSNIALLCIGGLAFGAWRIRGKSRSGRLKI